MEILKKSAGSGAGNFKKEIETYLWKKI